MNPSPLRRIRLGFVPLSDCAPLVVARKLDLGARYGLELDLQKQASWTSIRDKLIDGRLDAAHCLYGMVYGMDLGLGSPAEAMAVLIALNRNGQGITLSCPLSDEIAAGASLAEIAKRRQLVFAHTFPTGTHAMWLHYWLAAQRINPLRDVRMVVIPPPQMSEALASGLLDGFCAGQPWHAVAAARGLGRLCAHSSEIWPDHPEKVLACRRSWIDEDPARATDLCRVLLEACRWLQTPVHRSQAAHWLAEEGYLGVPGELIDAQWQSLLPGGPLEASFFADGAVNYPYLSDGLWFLSQFQRWGMVEADPAALERVRAVQQTELYTTAARSLGIAVPTAANRHSVLIDGVPWQGEEAGAYASGFAIRAGTATGSRAP
ncbi:CmpA/NrtA family ABC transporter substrate-binding protein [Niveibacterium terrae]|uniref:CmpA/NrtA family ABC transporter substrate-binding protein n=1 Tax=Niveibacterium terrae TaxID=3373598 RepID=UPI003A8EF3CE